MSTCFGLQGGLRHCGSVNSPSRSMMWWLMFLGRGCAANEPDHSPHWAPRHLNTVFNPHFSNPNSEREKNNNIDMDGYIWGPLCVFPIMLNYYCKASLLHYTARLDRLCLERAHISTRRWNIPVISRAHVITATVSLSGTETLGRGRHCSGKSGQMGLILLCFWALLSTLQCCELVQRYPQGAPVMWAVKRSSTGLKAPPPPFPPLPLPPPLDKAIDINVVFASVPLR